MSVSIFECVYLCNFVPYTPESVYAYICVYRCVFGQYLWEYVCMSVCLSIPVYRSTFVHVCVCVSVQLSDEMWSFFFLIDLYWSLIASQYCVSFCCTPK